MIIAQSLFIKKEDIPALKKAYRKAGFKVEDLSQIAEELSFDISMENELVFCRFLRQPLNGCLNGIQMIDQDHVGLEQILDILRLFFDDDQKGYVITTTGHQCELEGYHVQRDGVYEAERITVESNRGEKIEVEPYE